MTTARIILHLNTGTLYMYKKSAQHFQEYVLQCKTVDLQISCTCNTCTRNLQDIFCEGEQSRPCYLLITSIFLTAFVFD